MEVDGAPAAVPAAGASSTIPGSSVPAPGLSFPLSVPGAIPPPAPGSLASKMEAETRVKAIVALRGAVMVPSYDNISGLVDALDGDLGHVAASMTEDGHTQKSLALLGAAAMSILDSRHSDVQDDIALLRAGVEDEEWRHELVMKRVKKLEEAECWESAQRGGHEAENIRLNDENERLKNVLGGHEAKLRAQGANIQELAEENKGLRAEQKCLRADLADLAKIVNVLCQNQLADQEILDKTAALSLQ
ncbi:hypothetical protein OQA88_8919 [Cercophora sp. LCS_1]